MFNGHAPCGIVEEINGDRTDIPGDPVKPGDRIVWGHVTCGSCYYCSVALQLHAVTVTAVDSRVSL